MVNSSISIVCSIAWQSLGCLERAKQLSEKLALPLQDQPGLQHLPGLGEGAIVLYVSENKLELIIKHQSRLSHISIDFLSGELDYRRRFGGGKNQAIARAVGLKSHSGSNLLRVLDITAGFGKDAFMLTSLGCQVKMVERSLVMATLLEDGLFRAVKSENSTIQSIINAMELIKSDAKTYLTELKKDACPEVIYMDPMFPEHRKTALNKIEMRALRAVVGEDNDADALLPLALTKATRRVVVKRPVQASVLANLTPTFVVKGKSNRYDVYIIP